jgi:predicted nucleic acid-binding protein
VILVDTSVWIDHFRNNNEVLARLLDIGRVLAHPFVIGELALGNLRNREIILNALQDLPGATIARDDEVLRFIDLHALFGQGIGYIDAHLLAAARMTPDAALWTQDKRLLVAAKRLALAVDFAE